MIDIDHIINTFRNGELPSEESLVQLIERGHKEDVERVCEAARKVCEERFGHRVCLRGLVEVWSRCEGGCLYCGLRAENGALDRYEMSEGEIVGACREAYRLGLRTFVLQGGQVRGRDKVVERIVRTLKEEFSDAAITLSLGEQPREVYELWRKAGADRYLLRHETASEEHYRRLHPERMDYHHRRECLGWLKELGYWVGAGMMVGSPWQRAEDLVADLRYLHKLRPEMVGIGPFMPQSDTPLGEWPRGSVERTLLVVALVRLMLPNAMIPATTALASADGENGTLRGVLAGANVVMPNVTPQRYRSRYAIYDNKKSNGSEAAEGIDRLRADLQTIGYEIYWGK